MSASWFTRRTLLTLAVGAGVFGFSGCRKNAPAPVSGDMTAIVVVTNRGFYDVNVYAIRSAGVVGRRLGTISGGSGATLRIRESDQQPGGGVTLQLRAIGARSTWTSPTLNLGFGVVGRLDIASSSGGDLSRTMFYSLSQQPGTL
ncbi:MAG TPA: hypothetical protein DGD08_11135 [Gemmatimonas aurantiaca]|uniref:Uncharacterized protein n=2 Tax=Gemmatimonas aurantiaca TaxID=173480 RepID=C1ACM0_GEMAT|nr:hypothetical protein [Gemmatimonas aurantiaca]BAH40247.1 hypothetical protein GAU_3205 [Gemmatimonas aurantiaca T-27]HCT57743.1 hypothetical protein [Gemmatimonas aurantiaca]